MKYPVSRDKHLTVRGTPVLAVSGFSNSGKTTISKLIIKHFSSKGLRVGYVKHHHGCLMADKPGSDTDQVYQNGASATAIVAQDGCVLRWDKDEGPQPGDLLEGLVMLFDRPDLLLLEGFKDVPLPRLEILSHADNESYYAQSSKKPLYTIPTRQHENLLTEGQASNILTIVNEYICLCNSDNPI